MPALFTGEEEQIEMEGLASVASAHSCCHADLHLQWAKLNDLVWFGVICGWVHWVHLDRVRQAYIGTCHADLHLQWAKLNILVWFGVICGWVHWVQLDRVRQAYIGTCLHLFTERKKRRLRWREKFLSHILKRGED